MRGCSRQRRGRRRRRDRRGRGKGFLEEQRRLTCSARRWDRDGYTKDSHAARVLWRLIIRGLGRAVSAKLVSVDGFRGKEPVFGRSADAHC